jgi:hypothetical protein
MADEHDLVATQAGQAADDGRVIPILAVAVELAELPADHVHVVFEEGALGMAGHLDGFPGREAFVGLAEESGVVAAKLAKLPGVVGLASRLEHFQVTDLLFQLGQGLLELQDVPADRLGGGAI